MLEKICYIDLISLLCEPHCKGLLSGFYLQKSCKRMLILTPSYASKVARSWLKFLVTKIRLNVLSSVPHLSSPAYQLGQRSKVIQLQKMLNTVVVSDNSLTGPCACTRSSRQNIGLSLTISSSSYEKFLLCYFFLF